MHGWGELPGLADWQSSSSLGGRLFRFHFAGAVGSKGRGELPSGLNVPSSPFSSKLPILLLRSSAPTLGQGISWYHYPHLVGDCLLWPK